MSKMPSRGMEWAARHTHLEFRREDWAGDVYLEVVSM